MDHLDARTCDRTTLQTVLGEIGALRVAAWATRGVQVAGARDGLLLDDLDALAHHWFVRTPEGISAAARLTIHEAGAPLPDQLGAHAPSPIEAVAVLGRMVVSAATRGRGYAAQLDAARLAMVRDLGLVALVCTSNPSRLPALVSLGFLPVGTMVSSVTGRPATVLRREA